MAELPRVCEAGFKPNSTEQKEYWIGYKLQVDIADGQIPIQLCIDLAFDAAENRREAVVRAAEGFQYGFGGWVG